jgi:hypothetical protein
MLRTWPGSHMVSRRGHRLFAVGQFDAVTDHVRRGSIANAPLTTEDNEVDANVMWSRVSGGPQLYKEEAPRSHDALLRLKSARMHNKCGDEACLPFSWKSRTIILENDCLSGSDSTRFRTSGQTIRHGKIEVLGGLTSPVSPPIAWVQIGIRPRRRRCQTTVTILGSESE